MGLLGRLVRTAPTHAWAAMFLPSCSGTVLLKELQMPPAHISAALLAIALWATPILASAGHEPSPAATSSQGVAPAADREPAHQPAKPLSAQEDWRHALAETVTTARALVEAGYARAPALVIALSAFIVLPVVALGSYLVHTAARRRAQGAAIRAAQQRADTTEAASPMPAEQSMPLWAHEAWLTLEDGGTGTLPLAGQTIRIGRHQDNDIRLPDTTVHRYHAVIERTPEEAFVIVDLSGKQGNGIRINGERLARAQLNDGDVIELGRTRLKFESAPV
jgi:hypothetical protein